MSYLPPNHRGHRLTGDVHQLVATMPPPQRLRCASYLDRESDHALHLGNGDRAERCSERAAAIRATCLTPEHLGPRDERRFCEGWKAVTALGVRPSGMFLLQVVQEGRDLLGLLDLLDQWRASTVTPQMVQAAGGDRFPLRPLRRVG
jgi:hypothetical protein